MRVPYMARRLTATVRWPARRVVGEARYPSARGCAGGAIGTEAVPAVGGLRDSAGAPWERGDVARTSALPPPNHALERTGHSGHPWPAWGCPCGPPLTATVRLQKKGGNRCEFHGLMRLYNQWWVLVHFA